jgi:hypothetical protein
LANNLYLESSFKDIKIDLQEGLNYLELEAPNRGALGGNTGAYVYDKEGTYCCLTCGIILIQESNLNLHLLKNKRCLFELKRICVTLNFISALL